MIMCLFEFHQVDKAASNMSEPTSEEMQDAAFQSDEEEDEDVDETVFDQDSDSSQNSDHDDDDAK